MRKASTAARIQWVSQDEPGGDLSAAIAMVTGRSVRDVQESLASATNGAALLYLVSCGYEISERYRPPVTVQDWPPAPWCEAHICKVIPSPMETERAVVLLPDGTVLDPTKPGTFRLADYESVEWVIGLTEGRPARERSRAGVSTARNMPDIAADACQRLSGSSAI